MLSPSTDKNHFRYYSIMHYLAITNRANWEIIKKKGIWGVPERHRHVLESLKPGDRLFIYVKQEREKDKILEPAIVALVEVASEPFKDSTKVFKAPPHRPSERYPYRVRIKVLEEYNPPKPFKPLIPKLELFKGKKKWTAVLRGRSLVPLSADDVRVVAG